MLGETANLAKELLVEEVEKELRKVKEMEEPRRRESSSSTSEEATSQGGAEDTRGSTDILGNLRKRIRLEKEQEEVTLATSLIHLSFHPRMSPIHPLPGQSMSQLCFRQELTPLKLWQHPCLWWRTT